MPGKTLISKLAATFREEKSKMKNWKSFLYGLNPYLLSSIAGGLLVLQIILGFRLYNQAGIQALRVVGWSVWALGTAFALIPIFTFRRKGSVPKRKSYMHTTVLVDTGIYAIVRHPQGGVAGILLNLALPLIIQHWLVAILGVVAMGLICIDTLKSDQYCIEKFGDAYKRYMERVPRVNFVVGIMRLLRGRN
jgi:protein-S-isoprenylcysteine O-methyltransferase Ste14